MAKKSKAAEEVPRMKPTLYLRSDEIKIPAWLKGKLGEIIMLTVKTKVVSHQATQRAGEKQRENYDLEIQKIEFPSNLEKILRS